MRRSAVHVIADNDPIATMRKLGKTAADSRFHDGGVPHAAAQLDPHFPQPMRLPSNSAVAWISDMVEKLTVSARMGNARQQPLDLSQYRIQRHRRAAGAMRENAHPGHFLHAEPSANQRQHPLLPAGRGFRWIPVCGTTTGTDWWQIRVSRISIPTEKFASL